MERYGMTKDEWDSTRVLVRLGRKFYSVHGTKLKPMSRKLLSKVIGVSVPSWDDWQNMSRGVNFISHHIQILEDKNRNLAIMLYMYEKEAWQELKDFCQAYALTYCIDALPSIYCPLRTRTILIARDPSIWLFKVPGNSQIVPTGNPPLPTPQQ